MKFTRTILFFIGITFALASSAICPRFVVNKLDEGICKKSVSKGLFHISPCKPWEYCSWNSGDDKSPCEIMSGRNMPGEICNTNSDCRGRCVKGYCKGFGLHESCERDSQCDPGLFCFQHNERKFTCEPTKKLGDLCGSSDKGRCSIGLVCNLNRCVKVGSLPIGARVSNYRACSTYTDKKLKDGNHVCDEGAKLIRSSDDPKKGPIRCPSSGVCQYRESNKTISRGKCRCGGTTLGTSYCVPGDAEFNFRAFIKYYNSLTATSHISCAPFCLTKEYSKMGKQYYRIIKILYEVNIGQLLVDNSDDHKKVFAIDYYNATKALGNDTINTIRGMIDFDNKIVHRDSYHRADNYPIF